MNLLVVLGFIGIGQGLYVLSASWTLRFPLRSKISLTLLMGAHILLLLTAIFNEMDWFAHFPHFLYVRVPVPLLIGPSLYLLYRNVYLVEQPNWRSFFYHHIPFLAYLLLMVPYYLQGSTVKLNSPSLEPYLLVNYSWLEHFKIAHLLAYLIWIMVLVGRGENKIKYKSYLRPYRNLFFGMLLGYTVIIALSTTSIFLLNYGFDLVYGMEIVIALVTTLLAASIVYVFMRYEGQWKTVYRKRSGKISEMAGPIVLKLKALMEEQKVFRNSDLKLAHVATLLGLPEQQLSEALNNELEINFPEFVNDYRVKDFKTRLLDPKEQNKTMLGIAFESGFNSKSSFQRVFKESTGVTPTAYRKSLTNRSQNG